MDKPTNILVSHRGYMSQLFYDDVDRIYHGRVDNITGMIVFGGYTTEEVTQGFRDSVDTYIEACGEDGVEPEKPYVEIAAAFAKLPYETKLETELLNGRLCYTVTHPELLGCTAMGFSQAEAEAAAAEVRYEYCMVLLESRTKIPLPVAMPPPPACKSIAYWGKTQ
jgi:predicted RNase H-like HicB family nuclease